MTKAEIICVLLLVIACYGTLAVLDWQLAIVGFISHITIVLLAVVGLHLYKKYA